MDKNTKKRNYIIEKLYAIIEFCVEKEETYDKNGAPTGQKKMRDTNIALKALDSLSKHLGLTPAASPTEPALEPQINTVNNLDGDII